jgi:hypothetical protein
MGLRLLDLHQNDSSSQISHRERSNPKPSLVRDQEEAIQVKMLR